ncbi:hypothetical protein BLNAU_7443 [Blattamonas nauphoetae]|uniref:Uncharacterized protein n=1 Tax=Blattamonas nauphoetae TaxID=2049346 RepID=A0ABQ9Y1H8_9EUKA|nr:hypothetical protein BLNAU_7443 [Blattamonas nauphoetae]
MTTSKFLDDRTFKNKDQTVVGRRVCTVHQVYHDDKVESVCEDFCSTHRLPPTAKTALVEQVLETKETFNQKELRELDVCSR